jgi:hypothetical protein
MRGKYGNSPAARELLDRLAERLAAEQICVGLLDAMVRKVELAQDREGPIGIPPGQLDRFLFVKLRHVKLLERAILGLGGNPAWLPPSARRFALASASLQRLAHDQNASPLDGVAALQVAEITDRLGWKELVLLAGREGLGALEWEFRGALVEEIEQEKAFAEWRERWEAQSVREPRAA